MDISVSARRLAYRIAYHGLALVWRVAGVRPNGVKCVIVDGPSLLLVRHTYGPRAWDLPGGAAHPGEPPASTATREMGEELGLRLHDWHELGELRSRRGSHHVCVLGTEVSRPSLVLDAVELAEAAWFRHDALPAVTAPLLTAIRGNAEVTAFLAGAGRGGDHDRPTDRAGLSPARRRR